MERPIIFIRREHLGYYYDRQRGAKVNLIAVLTLVRYINGVVYVLTRFYLPVKYHLLILDDCIHLRAWDDSDLLSQFINCLKADC